MASKACASSVTVAPRALPLPDDGSVTGFEFDQVYAFARLTPGTNLLAIYTILGERLAGWRGAAGALLVGAAVPASIALAATALYVRYADHLFAARAMQGARAGALAVLLWAVVRLLRPQLQHQRTRGVILALVVLGLSLTARAPSFAILFIAACVGAVFSRREL